MKVHSFIETFKIFTFKLGKNGGGGGCHFEHECSDQGCKKGTLFPLQLDLQAAVSSSCVGNEN